MSAERVTLALGGTTWVWECDGCDGVSFWTFPDEAAADEALRHHREDHCRPVAA